MRSSWARATSRSPAPRPATITTATGNGGRIIAWSDGGTSVAGSLSAQGGARGGDGGFIETSGHELGVSARINLGAAKGALGTWLLDPTTVTIQDGSDTGNSTGAVVTVGTL